MSKGNQLKIKVNHIDQIEKDVKAAKVLSGQKHNISGELFEAATDVLMEAIKPEVLNEAYKERLKQLKGDIWRKAEVFEPIPIEVVTEYNNIINRTK